MAIERKDAVQFASTTAGITSFGIGAAIASFRTPAVALVTDGAQVYYVAYTATERECGIGTYSSGGATISRTTIYATVGSLSGGKVNFGSNPTVGIAPIAESFDDIAFDGNLHHDMDTNGFDIQFDDGTGILSSEAGNPPLLLFESVASSDNFLTMFNGTPGVGPFNSPGMYSNGDRGTVLFKPNPAGTEGGFMFYAGTTQATADATCIFEVDVADASAAAISIVADAGIQIFSGDLTGNFLTPIEILGSPISLVTDINEDAPTLLINASVASPVNYLSISNAATGNGPTITSEGEALRPLNFASQAGQYNFGANLQTNVYAPGQFAGASWGVGSGASFGFSVTDNGATSMVNATSFADDGLSFTSWDVPSNNYATLYFNGSPIDFSTDAAGGTNTLVLNASVASAVNYLSITNAATGTPPILASTGTDTDIDLSLLPKGAGVVKFGAFTASATPPVTGYISIKDSGGTVRHLAVV